MMETVSVLHADTNGTVVPVTGGFPLRIDAPITLCARSDLDPSRFYNGALANLGIYDSQLSAAQIHAIYQQVRRSERAAPAPFILDSEALSVAQGQAIIQQVQVENAEGEIQPFKLVYVQYMKCRAIFKHCCGESLVFHFTSFWDILE